VVWHTQRLSECVYICIFTHVYEYAYIYVCINIDAYIYEYMYVCMNKTVALCCL